MKKLNISKIKSKKFKSLSSKKFFSKFLYFFYLKFLDIKKNIGKNYFNEFGLTIYCGRQGDGKTISMVEKLEEIRHKYPEVKIATNFGYKYQDVELVDWLQLLELRNDKGIVFAIDEIQNEFNVYETRKFSENLLRVVTQQRKQGIKIYATSQVFSRVSKPLREQTFEVVECKTLLGRWTFQKAFDADEYNACIDNPLKKEKLMRLWRKNFVQTDSLRDLFDSYAVINGMLKLEKSERKKEK